MIKYPKYEVVTATNNFPIVTNTFPNPSTKANLTGLTAINQKDPYADLQKFVPTKAILIQACSDSYLKQELKHSTQHVKHLARLAVFLSFDSFAPYSTNFKKVMRMYKTDNTNDPKANDPAW